MTSGADIKKIARGSEIKLQEEKNRLAVLKDSLTRSNVLTSSMVSTLDNFERKLESLDELVTPVYEATNELRLLLNNVDNSLILVDSILHYYQICGELQPKISSGPGGDLDEYLTELDRLEDAVKYFKRITTGVNERERITQLFDLGRQRLVEETDRLILRYANPLLPKELIELCDMSEANRNELHTMQEVDMGTLRKIIEWFSAHGFRQGLIDSYATKRGTMIRRSLQLLAEHSAKSSLRRSSTNVMASSPNISQHSLSTTDLSKRSGKLMSDVTRRTGRSTGSGTLPRSANAPSANTLSVIEDNMIMDSNEHRETYNYKVLLDAFVILLQRDRDLLNYVFPNDLQLLVFTKLVELPLAHMREEAQRLSESIKQLPHKLDIGKFAIYGIFTILRWFLKFRETLNKLSQESDVARRQQFATLSTTFEQTAVACLRAILDEATNDTSPLSPGGNVHPLTSHVLAFMEGLLGFEDTATIVASIYVEQDPRISSGGVSGPQKGLYDLGTYFSRLVRSLYTNLAKKVEAHMPRTDVTIRAIFLLNNINYLLKRLESSTLLAMIQRCQPDFKTKCETDLQTSFHEVTKCYTSVIGPMQQMFDLDNSNRLPDTKLRDRDRELLKDSFSSVNSAIDAIMQQCGQYIVSDVSLRERLRNEARKQILELFRKYYDRFAHKDFTKNRDKYIRYEPQSLDALIGRLFENYS